jgi:hypothetical protein
MFLPSSLSIGLPRTPLDPIDESLWYPSEVPPAAAVTGTEAVGFNGGCLFTVQTVGDIHALCYYRDSAMPSSGSMSLWSIGTGGDQLIETVAFTGHSGSGWKVLPLVTPHRANAARGYVVSFWQPAVAGHITIFDTLGYFQDSGRYSANGFLYAQVSNGQMDPRGFSHRNGLYSEGALSRPDQFYAHDFYWVDVIINARPKPVPPLPPIVLKWPIPEGYPTLDSTGPDPDTVFTDYPEGFSSSSDGQVIEGVNASRVIAINHNNVTLRNSKYVGTGPLGISIAAGMTGTLVEQCSVDMIGRGNEGATAIAIANGAEATIRTCNIYRCENAIAPYGGNSGLVIEANFIHNMRSTPGHPHYDGIQCDGNNGDLTILDNTIFNENGDTSAIMIDNSAGASDNILVEGNYLAGGGYTCYCDGRFGGAALGGLGGGPLTNVRYHNNIMRPGGYGYWFVQDATPERLGNQFLAHGGIYDAAPPGGFTVGQTVPECFFGIPADIAASVVGEGVAAGTGVTLGLSFTPNKNGTITGLNFYRPGDTSTALVSIGLWRWLGANKTGGVALLATKAFTNVNPRQWVGFAFDAPVPVSIDENYVIGVFIPRGSDGKCWYLAGNDYFLANVPSQHGNLYAFNNVGAVLNGFVGCNGMYEYGSDLVAPVKAGGSHTNYYVDPVFSAAWS